MKPRRLLAIIPVAVGIFGLTGKAKNLIMALNVKWYWLMLWVFVLALSMAALMYWSLS